MPVSLISFVEWRRFEYSVLSLLASDAAVTRKYNPDGGKGGEIVDEVNVPLASLFISLTWKLISSLKPINEGLV